MKRRWFAAFGGSVLVGEVALYAWLPGSPEATVVGLLVGLGAVLFVLGGVDPVPARVPWYRFLGAGVLAFGATVVAAWVPPALAPGATRADVALAVAGAANGLVLGVVGADWLRGGHHFRLSTLEPGPLFGDGGDEPEG